jgi:succinoglycan biosynthesis protein ExoA
MAPPTSDWPMVSTVLPVLNEARHLRAAVDSILAQDYPGEVEVVLALGPSRDATDEIAAAIARGDPRVTCISNPTGRTPAALNLAIAASRGSVIARIDGHSELPRDYLRVAVETLQRTGADNVGGLMWAEGTTPFEVAVARAMTSRFGVGNAPFHVGGEEGRADTVYLGVFRREALERVGGYDESFVRAQDWEMNYRLRQTGGIVWFNPQLRVAYRPRNNVRDLAGQYFYYGRWRREVMRRHPDSINLRYLAPPFALAGLCVGTLAGVFGGLWPWLYLGFLAPVMYAVAVVVAAAVTGRGLPTVARLWLTAVYPTMHLSWGSGFVRGLITRTSRSVQ